MFYLSTCDYCVKILSMREVHKLKPIYDKNSKALILGSFPSVVSREKNMYYSHPKNRFWMVLENLFNESIINKEEFLLKHNIALWDVCASCEIEASKDESIKNVKVNDIGKILKEANIKKIFVLGNKAYSLYQKYIYPKLKIDVIKLSSTSPANARKSLEDLTDEYEIILKYLNM